MQSKALFLLGIIIFMNVDGSSIGEYIWRSLRNFYKSFSDMCISVPPAEASVGVCSMLYPRLLSLVVTRFLCDSLLSDIQIISALLDSKLKNISRSSICDESEDMFKCIM